MIRKCSILRHFLMFGLISQLLLIKTVPLYTNCQIHEQQEDHDEPRSLKGQLLKQHLDRDCNEADCSDIAMSLGLPTQQPSQLTTSHQASFGENINHLANSAAVPVAPEQQAEIAARQQQQQQQQQQRQQQQQQRQQQQQQQQLQLQLQQQQQHHLQQQQSSQLQLQPQQQQQQQHQPPYNLQTNGSPNSQVHQQTSAQQQQQHAQQPQQTQPQVQHQPQQATTPPQPIQAQVQTPAPLLHSPVPPYTAASNIINSQPQQQQQQQQQHQQQPQVHLPTTTPVPVPRETLQHQQPTLSSYSSSNYHHHSNSPLYFGHNPFIERLRPQSYADDNIVTLNLSHSHIYEIDSDAFVGQRFEHIDLSNNKLGLIHSRSFRIGPYHSKHTPYNPHNNSSKPNGSVYPTRRPPPTHPKSVTIDFSHNPAIVALSGAFDHIDVPNCLLNFTNSTVELKFGAFKKYFKEHPGHIIDIESVDCCEQEWLLGYKHNFVPKTHCDHDPNLLLTKIPQQQIIDSCIAYVTSARHSMTIQGPSIIHQVAALPRSHSNSHTDNQYTTYLILGGTAMILTSLSIYIIFYMFSLKAAFVYQMQNKN